jgi:isopentenyl phosphate kinase
VGLEDF